MKKFKSEIKLDEGIEQNSMKRYKPSIILKEDENEVDEKIKELISTLRDENFGNEDQRKKMLDILTSLYVLDGIHVRRLFKKMGHALTDIGHEILGTSDDVQDDDLDIDEVPVEDNFSMEGDVSPYAGIDDFSEMPVDDTMDVVEEPKGELDLDIPVEDVEEDKPWERYNPVQW